jgi:S1-C subfamily serine protease
MVLGIGAAAGGAAAYIWLRDEIPAVRAAGDHEMIFKTTSDGNPDEGVIIFHVQAGSPAEAAGLVRGDIVLAVDGQPVNSFLEFSQVISGFQSGDTVNLKVLHGDEERQVEVTLDEKGSRAFMGVATCIGPLGEAMTLQDGPMVFDRELAFIHKGGVVVTELVADGPAEKAGLKSGDRITHLDGEEIGVGTSLADKLEEYMPGQVVEVTIMRDGAEETMKVELSEHPDKPGVPYLGIYYRPVGPEMMLDFQRDGSHFQLPALPFDEFQHGDQPPFFFHGMGEFQDLPEGYDRAIILGEVLADSPADQAGLQAGDLILVVEGEPVDTIQAFVEGIQAHKPGDEITLLVFREGEQIQVQATLAAHPDNADLGYLGVKATGFMKMERNRDQEFNQENEIKIPGDDA